MVSAVTSYVPRTLPGTPPLCGGRETKHAGQSPALCTASTRDEVIQRAGVGQKLSRRSTGNDMHRLSGQLSSPAASGTTGTF